MCGRAESLHGLRVPPEPPTSSPVSRPRRTRGIDGKLQSLHNGYFKTLRGLVHFYNTRDVKPVCPEPVPEHEALARNCWPVPEVTANMNTEELGNLGLSPAEEAAIVAFMATLSDEPAAGEERRRK